MSSSNETLNELIDDIDKIQKSSNGEELDQTINKLKKEMKTNVDYLNEESIDLANKLFVMQKLCFFYEDLYNCKNQPNKLPMNCSLMTTAYNDLYQATDYYIHFARFISRHRNKIFSQEGSGKYIFRMQNKIRNLNKRFFPENKTD